ncbi:NAD nucleotidase [Desulfurobacterium atlanticum]|uniref:5'-nucleotidase n=1 Tax=Desulfurobacterium atlanticum TaxID=240169 RepID=A0A238Z7E1_9BACT|nr:NAD nucleotidase [Desulfurobacterium atlanticum]SNR78743.1 5'-nucleotidase [Desulfurobacterium atlanticum]
MNRKIKVSTPLLIFSIAFSGCGKQAVKTTPEVEKKTTITFIHMNDIHSHLSGSKTKLYFNGKKTYVTIGELNRAIAKIKELQKTSSNPVTLNAGDMIVGTLYYVLFRGNATADLLNLVNWDAATIGNHEFDDGDKGLKHFLDRINFPIVSANIIPKKGSILEYYWTPYRIIERNGEKIGIIGIGYAQKTKMSSNPGNDIEFLDEIETAKKYVKELSDLGVNKIVILSHFGMENDLKLAKEVPGVDVIIDGDSHSLLGNYTAYGIKSQFNKYPQIVKGADGQKVCVTSAWQYGYAVGKLKVDFDSKGNVIECNGVTTILLGDEFKRKVNGKKVKLKGSEKAEIEEIIANSNGKLEIVKPDPEAEKILNSYSEKVETLKRQVIGFAAEFLGHNRIPGDKKDGVSVLSKHGSEIAPIVAKAFYEKIKNADVAIQNAGGVRTAIDDGPITIGEVYKLLPFSNTLYVLKMKGSEIKQVLEDAISNFMDKGGSTGSFPYAYGIRYDVDLSKPCGKRISNLEIMDRKTKIWHPIDPNRYYIVVTNSYIAHGKDGYKTFGKVLKERGGIDTYFGYAETFIDYIKKLSAKGKELKKLPRDEMPVQNFTK